MNKNPPGELRSTQIEGIEVLKKSKRHLLADIMGYGKTTIALHAVEELGAYPLLVNATTNALGVWQREARDWLGRSSVIYTGTPKQRRAKWDEFVSSGAPILIANYSFLDEIRELRPYWPAKAADEIHLAGLLNSKTQTYGKYEQIKSDCLYLLTGSPFRKSPADFYAPLHLINPKKFNSYWGFVRRHCITIKHAFGTDIEARPRNPREFRAMLNQYMLRRCDESYLPRRIRVPIPIQMTPIQAKLYNQLVTDMIAESDGQLLITSTPLARDGKLRQLLVSPRLLGFKEKGAALSAIPEIVAREFAEQNSLVLFTPYRRGVDLIIDELKALPADIRPEFIGRLMGGMSGQEVTDITEYFQEYKSHKKVIVATVKSGTSYTLTEANASYFFGFEYDFNHDEQAEKRLHRTGQKRMVRNNYILNQGTLDEHVLNIVSGKKAGANWILKPVHLLPETYRKIL